MGMLCIVTTEKNNSVTSIELCHVVVVLCGCDGILTAVMCHVKYVHKSNTINNAVKNFDFQLFNKLL